MIERDVKKSLREYLSKIGAYQFWPVPTGYGATTVDCLFCHEGKFFAVECKRPGVTKETPRQQATLQEIIRAGGAQCVENDVELHNVKQMIASRR